MAADKIHQAKIDGLDTRQRGDLPCLAERSGGFYQDMDGYCPFDSKFGPQLIQHFDLLAGIFGAFGLGQNQIGQALTGLGQQNA